MVMVVMAMADAAACSVCRVDHSNRVNCRRILDGPVFLALVTDAYVSEAHHHEEIAIAEAHDKDLVAMTEAGTDWGAYEEYEWDHIVTIEDRDDETAVQAATEELAEVFRRAEEDG